jgi:hypothetical protein
VPAFHYGCKMLFYNFLCVNCPPSSLLRNFATYEISLRTLPRMADVPKLIP